LDDDKQYSEKSYWEKLFDSLRSWNKWLCWKIKIMQTILKIMIKWL
jgi:hypothetical protein